MNPTVTFARIPARWELSFERVGDASPALVIRGPEKEALRVEADLTVTARTLWRQRSERFGENPEFDFSLSSARNGRRISVRWLGYALQLFVDGALEDEEWPLGELPEGPWTVEAAQGIENIALRPLDAPDEVPETTFDGPFQNYNHPGHNTGVGDCMPFARDGRWCLYYLLDRRGHRSKRGLGAHQWAQVSTDDLRHWTIHPMAVGITEQWEGSICTGSLIQKDGKTYAFYAVRMSDGSPARLTWAESADGVHFEKSGRYFSLTDPYEPVSARDPNVFFGADGLYHMLVTTSLVDGGRFGGCLAHLTSPDLMDWTQHEPFIVPGYSDQPECSDHFQWNGWYYLVFSNFAIARYRMSRQPFGPWTRPENDLLDALEVQVPKTAPFRGRRLSSGFLARRPRSYAGNAVTHELFQRADGTLGLRQAEELLPVPKRVQPVEPVLLSAPQGRAEATLAEIVGAFRLKATLRVEGDGTLFGLTLGDGRGVTRVEFDPAARTAVIIRPHEDFDQGAGRDLARCVGLTGDVPVDLLVMGDILDLMFGDGRCMTLRMDAPFSPDARIALYVQCGALSASRIEWQTF